MKPTRRRILLYLLLTFVPIVASGRLFEIPDPKKLFADAKLVFVGEVKSVEPSEIKTTLSYIPYEGVTFQWQVVKVEVIEPFKGVQKAGLVKTAMLSIDPLSPVKIMDSPPGMLKPEKGDIFLFFLAPSAQTNLFAALTAPYDENLSVLALHRRRQIFDARDEINQPCDTRDFMNRGLSSSDARFAVLLGLLDGAGKMVPPNADRVRETYALEILTAARTNVIYLEWETRINPSGWQSDWPKKQVTTTNVYRR